MTVESQSSYISTVTFFGRVLNKSYISNSVEDSLTIGREIGEKAVRGTIVALYGSLGAGKTVLTKGIGKAIGVQEEITSPTFIIVSEYQGEIDLRHIDLYRINTFEELEDLGFEELLSDDCVTVIEWAERAGTILPDNTLRVNIEVKADQTRYIHIAGWM